MRKIILILTFILHPAFAAPAPFRVMLDPGHGGQDWGATKIQGGKRLSEKDLTLKLAKLLAANLQARKGYAVGLTRETDTEVPLSVRTAMANQMKAQVFISIHMNSSPDGNRNHISNGGFETYILNNASDESSKRLAHFENSVLSGSALPQGAGKDGTTDIALILKDLRLDANLPESKRLACSIQNTLAKASPHLKAKGITPPKSRGVKQALFYVLLGSDMPSVLLEAGFLNSAVDRAALTSPVGQAVLVDALADAVESFRLKRACR